MFPCSLLGRLGLEIDEDAFIKSAANATVDICAGTKITEWSRGKWLGYEISLDSYLQNHLINNVGYYAWQLLMTRTGKSPAIKDRSNAVPVPAADGTAAALGTSSQGSCETICKLMGGLISYFFPKEIEGRTTRLSASMH